MKPVCRSSTSGPPTRSGNEASVPVLSKPPKGGAATPARPFPTRPPTMGGTLGSVQGGTEGLLGAVRAPPKAALSTHTPAGDGREALHPCWAPSTHAEPISRRDRRPAGRHPSPRAALRPAGSHAGAAERSPASPPESLGSERLASRGEENFRDPDVRRITLPSWNLPCLCARAGARPSSSRTIRFRQSTTHGAARSGCAGERAGVRRVWS